MDHSYDLNEKRYSRASLKVGTFLDEDFKASDEVHKSSASDNFFGIIPAKKLQKETKSEEKNLDETRKMASKVQIDLETKTATSTSNDNVKAEFVNGINYSESTDNETMIKEDLVKMHWKLLDKLDMQRTVIENLFFHIFSEYPHIRPLWAFICNISTKDIDWRAKLINHGPFRHHCVNFQTILTKITQKFKYDRSFFKMLENLGEHHFYYDACEPHLELIEDGLMTALRKLEKTEAKMDKKLEQAWLDVFSNIKTSFKRGIESQRIKYLMLCMTPKEMDHIKKMWEKVVAHGLEDAGLCLCGGALQVYNSLINQQNIAESLNIDQNGEHFRQFAKQTIEALNTTIDTYRMNGLEGFSNLPNRLQNYMNHYVIMDVCPIFVRKAFIEGLFSMLTYVLGEAEMTELVQQSWTKLYRAIEQSIMVNIIKF